MGSVLPKLTVPAAVFILVGGCSRASTASPENTSGASTSSISTNAESADSHAQDHKKSEETIRTVLMGIFTGPDNEQEKLFKNQATEDPKALYPYLEEKYKSLLDEQYFQDFINTNQGTTWLQTALMAGYQLKPATTIDVQKAESGGYTFEFNVAYSKNGETSTATVSGDCNTTDDGRVVALDYVVLVFYRHIQVSFLNSQRELHEYF